MMRLTARSVRSSHHTTNYWESGPDHGPLMVFLHGWPGSGLMWRAQIEAFASEGWRCVAPDMRGYGGSSAPSAAEAYALHEIVGDIVELHDHLGARPAIWVGHDFGTSKPMTPEQRKDHMLAEITATLQLYLDGRIDQFWHRYDGKGVVFVMTTGSIEEADALLKALPLGVAGILSFELIPIGPLRSINALLEAAKPPPLVAIRKEVG